MGRLGKFLAGDWAVSQGRPVYPDFAVLSKGLTGGFLPLSAVLTTQAVYDLFWDDYVTGKAFLHSNTYCGNALAVAVAHAALDVFAEEDILGLVGRRGPWLRQGLMEGPARRPWVANVRGCGMMAALDLTGPDGRSLDPRARTGYRVYREAVRRGALLRPLGDTMYLFPPLTATEGEIAQMTAILADSLDAVLGVK
jgi:adenosylmethionine-8-amino-7-oxononanoate aminotransferase